MGTLGYQLLVMVGEVVGPLGGGTLLEELSYVAGMEVWNLRVHSPSQPPIHCSCFKSVAEEVISQLHAPAT